MPILSTFFGITVRMYNESGERHHVPHIHCTFGEKDATIDFDGNVLEGTLPKNKLKLVEAWIEIHKEELLENWILLSNGEKHYRIDPLK